LDDSVLGSPDGNFIVDGDDRDMDMNMDMDMDMESDWNAEIRDSDVEVEIGDSYSDVDEYPESLESDIEADANTEEEAGNNESLHDRLNESLADLDDVLLDEDDESSDIAALGKIAGAINEKLFDAVDLGVRDFFSYFTFFALTIE
jgi:hypothetical protein